MVLEIDMNQVEMQAECAVCGSSLKLSEGLNSIKDGHYPRTSIRWQSDRALEDFV